MSTPDRDPAREAVDRLRIAPPDRIGVAVSGGPDSLAALVLLADSCSRRGVPVVALHVDHGLRARAAAEDQAIVERVARAIGVGFASRKIDVLGARAKDGGSIEFVARLLRHDALAAMAIELHLTHVALAHHKDDQIETVLLSLLRGAWPGALAGIPRERRMPGGALLIRPFLSVPRDALRVHSARFAPAADAMNLDESHRRVAVRLSLLPALRASAPDVDDVILAIAHAAGTLDAAAAAAAELLTRSAGVHIEPGVAVAPASVLRRAGRFTRSRFLRALCDGDASFGHATWPLFDSFERAVVSEAAWSVDVRRGVRLTAREGLVSLFTTRPAAASGTTVVWDGAPARIEVDSIRHIRIEPLPPDATPRLDVTTAALYLPPRATIEVRPRRARDRFRLGPQGTKLVADELSDRKIQPAWRPRIPLVFISGELRWIPGLRVIPRAADPPPNTRLTIDGPLPWR